MKIEVNSDSVEQLLTRWRNISQNLRACAEREESEAGKRCLEFGAQWIFNCAMDIKAILPLPPQPSDIPLKDQT